MATNKALERTASPLARRYEVTPGGDEIASVDVIDVRFPTSLQLDGSDALNVDPDYSGAYVTLRTAAGDQGNSLVFTVGRGTELEVSAVQMLSKLVIGRSLTTVADLSALSLLLTGDPQIRWLGPSKGVVHMAAGGLLNAAWDLVARRAEIPLWKLLVSLTPDEVVALIDFTYITDALSPDEARDVLNAQRPDVATRVDRLEQDGHPAYTTTPGWLGYDDDKMARLAAQAQADGFPMVKLKVGARPSDDLRRLGIARRTLGPDFPIAVDANQVWGVPQAIRQMEALAPFSPYWIEEPTSPDDISGHATIRRSISPIRVATGEHVHNAVMFKQYLQLGALDVLQIDACRVAGVNENLAILLLAKKFGVPVCPHAGGVGLCEMVQHLAMYDYAAVSGTFEGRFIEYSDHLHEHFSAPALVRSGRYLAPRTPGAGAELLPESADTYRFPDGSYWQRR